MKNIYKRISAAVIAIAMIIMIIPMSENVFVSADSAIWDGTTKTAVTPVGNVYSVGNGAELAWIAQQVNDGNNFSGKTIDLTDNIVLNSGIIDENSTTANAWTAIGRTDVPTDKPFSGAFDGKGHTVSGVYINSTAGFQGLFGLSNGTIKNVGVINSYIKGTGYYVGGVAGLNQNIITNCYNTGAVSGNVRSGGVVGANDGSTLNCYNTGAVSGNARIGGVVGENNGSTSNCYNTGAVSGTNNVGGVVGCNSTGTIANSYNTGAVSGTNYVGGVFGANSGSTSNCYNTGAVSGTSYLGGVVGDNSGNTSNCYNTGAVSGTGQYVGGVTGYNQNIITNCYNTSAVSGTNYVGGVAGYNDNSTITNNYYYGCDVGVGGDNASQTGTTPFVKIADNPLGTGKTTTIAEQTTTDINTAWLNSLGAGFAVAFSDTYSSSDTSVATISDTTITGVSGGNSTISGRTMTITQNELTATGFDGATKTISVSISMPLTVITLVDAAAPTFGTDLSGTVTYTKDETATALTVSATVTDTGTISYQWYKNTTNSTTGGTAITGATNATYTPPTDTVGTSYYYVIATNTNNSVNGTKTATATSGVKTVVVNAIVNAVVPTFSTDLSGTDTYTKDATATPLTVSATATDTGTVSYQWYKNTVNNNTTGTTISGATNATYTPPTDTVGTRYYYVIATNTNNSATGTKTATATSGVKIIVVNAAIIPLAILNQPQSVTVNTGETATLTVTSSGSGTLSYQWYSSTTSSNIGGTAITGATYSTYSVPTTSAGSTYYYCVVTDMGTSKTVTTLAVKAEVISSSNPTNPSSPSTPSSSSNSSSSNSSKTIKVIETPTGIENPQLIGVTASDNAFNQSVEVRLKDDAAAKKAIEQALTEEYADILKDVTIFPLDISLYIKGTNTKVQPNAGTSVEITCPIPKELLANKDNIKIVCVVDGKLQILPTKIIQKDGVYCVVFTTNHFSPYAFLVSKDIQVEDVAAGAPVICNANPVTDDASPIRDNGLPYAVVLIGITAFGIIRKLTKKAK